MEKNLKLLSSALAFLALVTTVLFGEAIYKFSLAFTDTAGSVVKHLPPTLLLFLLSSVLVMASLVALGYLLARLGRIPWVVMLLSACCLGICGYVYYSLLVGEGLFRFLPILFGFGEVSF